MAKESPAKDLNKYTVAELKEELTARGLPVAGVKKDLVERLLDDDKCNADTHIDDDIIEANSREIDDHLPEEPDEGDKTNNIETEMTDEQNTEEGIHSDDELDEVLGDNVREAFEEMKDDEYDDEQEYVTLDKVDDKDGEEVPDDDVKKSSKEKDKSSKESKDDEQSEQLPVPPEQLHKWFFKQSSAAKKYSSLFISEMTAKDVLCPVIVEWANRAAVFCINHDRDGKGASMMNFSSEKECKEARDALQEALGEGIKISHPSSATESDIKDALCYRFDGIAALGQKWLTVEDAPPHTTEDQINSLFPEGLLAFRPDMKTQAYDWQSKEYDLPDKVDKIFLVEFANPKKASAAVADNKEYEFEGVKVKVQLLTDYEDLYKKRYAKELNDRRERRWEELEQKKKESLSSDIKLTNEERLQCYRDLEKTVNQRARLIRNPSITWEEKMLEKQKCTAKVYDVVRKIDADTNRRVKEEEKFPEHSRIMTRHTKTEFLKLAPHQRGTYEGKFEDTLVSWKSSSRGGRGGGYSGSRPSDYTGRGRGEYSYRGRGSDRGRGGYRGRASSYHNRDSSYSKSQYSSYQDTKRRRTDEYDTYSYDKRPPRKEDSSVVTSALKSLTEVLSTKMDEMSRIAGGMKARERELEDAVHSLKRKGDRSPATARYHDEGYSTSQRRGRGGARGSYSQSYPSYSRSSSGGQPSQSRYNSADTGYTSSSSRYHESYSSSDRHYASRDDRRGGYNTERRSSYTGNSGTSRRGGGGYH